MLFGRVKGTAICTIKYPGTEGLKLLIVQQLNKQHGTCRHSAGRCGRGTGRTR